MDGIFNRRFDKSNDKEDRSRIQLPAESDRADSEEEPDEHDRYARPDDQARSFFVVDQFPYLMGKQAASMLHEMIKGRWMQPKVQIIDTHLVIRDLT